MHKINSLLSRFNMRQFISRLGDGRSASTKKVTTMSYTKTEIQKLVAASPLTFDKAQEIALELGKSQRSIIAKAKSLGLDYIPKPKAAKRPAGETKADLVNRIAVAVGGDSADLLGLEKATAGSLSALLAAIR